MGEERRKVRREGDPKMHSAAVDTAPGTVDSDQPLVSAAQAGDRDAFSRLVSRYRGLVFAYALAVLRDRDAAEDAAQDSFARSFASLDRLRGPRAFQPWLMQITRNVCRDALRRRAIRKAEPLDVAWLADELSPEAEVLSGETRRQVCEAVANLPDELRVPLLMRVASQCTYREIALALSLPETTVVGRTFRAIRLLRQRFQELDR
jgi:RNA polymerase sigma-70 factor (ECF subfamily)